MILDFTETIKAVLSENNKNNTVSIENILQGGSDDKFTVTLGNDFQINDIEQRNYELDPSNTFNKNVLSDLVTPLSDISFIMIFCYIMTDSDKATPLRFTVALDGPLALGDMSKFSLTNIKSFGLTELNISGITVPADKRAALTVIVGTKKKY